MSTMLVKCCNRCRWEPMPPRKDANDRGVICRRLTSSKQGAKREAFEIADHAVVFDSCGDVSGELNVEQPTDQGQANEGHAPPADRAGVRAHVVPIQGRVLAKRGGDVHDPHKAFPGVARAVHGQGDEETLGWDDRDLVAEEGHPIESCAADVLPRVKREPRQVSRDVNLQMNPSGFMVEVVMKDVSREGLELLTGQVPVGCIAVVEERLAELGRVRSRDDQVDVAGVANEAVVVKALRKDGTFERAPRHERVLEDARDSDNFRGEEEGSLGEGEPSRSELRA